MKRILTLVVLALFGCDETPTTNAPADVSAFRAALPSTAWLSIDVPFASQAPQNAASLHGFTRSVSTGVNLFAVNIAHIIQDLVDVAPVESDGETYAQWGPLTDPLSPATWRVTVRKVGEDRFEHTLEGWPRGGTAAQAQRVVWGEHHPEGEGATGWWTYDLTAGRALDSVTHDSIGQVELTYTVDPLERSLEARFIEVQGPRDPISTSTQYRYRTGLEGGSFDYMANFDIDEDDDPTRPRRELVQARARWLSDGAGRADLVASNGDLAPDVEAHLNQCWGPDFAQVWNHFTVEGVVDQQAGDATLCAFDTAERPGFEVEGFADSDFVRVLPTAIAFSVGTIPVQDPVAEPAEYFLHAQQALLSVEQYLLWMLGTFREITRYPVTSCDSASCTWGPWTEWETQLSSRVVVDRVAEGEYAYRLETKAFGTQEGWQALLGGVFIDGEDASSGQGVFTLNLAKLRESDGNEDIQADQLHVEFTRRGTAGQMGVWLDGVPGPPGLTQARYFVSNSALGGRIDLETPANINKDEPGKEAFERLVSVYRWRQDGAGDGMIWVSEGDVGAFQTLVGLECWGPQAEQIHQSFVVQRVGQMPSPERGEGCAFQDEIEPQFRAPEFPDP